eukprot:TRINITY_DN4419_c0_g1_i1.p1 TRINITY_DN4419_c0_g1~~TRINITY_DN4419_c0_g1_i1.p1  ORF type:complete len:169 (+),score=26.88 TRINITY_DN4419_c0_g1_i1:964-1470(+)
MQTIMTRRLGATKSIKTLWSKGKYLQAIDTLAKINDVASLFECLPLLCSSDSFSLIETSMAILPLLKELLLTPHEEYVRRAVTNIKMVLDRWVGVIIVESPDEGGSGKVLFKGVGGKVEKESENIYDVFVAVKNQLDILDKQSDSRVKAGVDELLHNKRFADLLWGCL